MATPEAPSRTPSAGQVPASARPAGESGIGRIALVVVGVVLGALWVWFLYSNGVSQAVRKLYADDPDTRKEGIRILEEHEDRAEVNRQLIDTLEDTSESYAVRRTCADLLRKNEQLPRLEALLRDSDPARRFPALDVLANQSYFKTTYLNDPTYDIPGTLAAWLGRDGDLSRRRAIEIVRSQQQKQLVEAIRPLLYRSERANVDQIQEGRLIRAAAAALQGLADCGSAPELLALSCDDPDPRVRMEMMQSAHKLVTQHATCAGALPEGALQQRVKDALGEDHKLLRMSAVVIMKFEKPWAVAERERLREILNSAYDDGERRGVLELLVATADEAFEREIPRWFHADRAPLRSSATQAVSRWVPKENAYIGSLIGIVRDEEESQLGYEAALRQLLRASGGQHGLGPWIPELRTISLERWHSLTRGLFEGRETQGITREAFTNAWFSWLARERGLDDEATKQALASRAAFWNAANKGDAAAAKAALDAAVDDEQLWSYERGWLMARS